MILPGKKLKKYVVEAVSEYKFSSAIKLILNTAQASHLWKSDCRFILISIHRLLESILFEHSIHKTLSFFIRQNRLSKTSIEALLEDFHHWLVLSFDFSTATNPSHFCSPDQAHSKEIIRLAILIVQQNLRIWKSRFAMARLLLLFRTLNYLKLLQIPPDTRCLVLLLAGLQDNPHFREISSKFPLILFNRLISHLVRQKWELKHDTDNIKCHGSLSVDVRIQQRCEETLLSWKQLAQLCKAGITAGFDIKELSEYHIFNRHAHRDIVCSMAPLSQVILAASSLYQILTPRRISNLEELWTWLKNCSTSSTTSDNMVLQRLAFEVNDFESAEKRYYLRAINEALQSPRPKHRHGAILVKRSSMGCEKDVIIATGYNKSVKELSNLQRIRHAEIGCLLQSVDDAGQLPSLKDLTEHRHKRRRLKTKCSYHIYIVEIDDYEVGYSDSQACPSCTAALIKSGVQYQHYTTSDGFISESIKQHNPNISAPTLDVVLPPRKTSQFSSSSRQVQDSCDRSDRQIWTMLAKPSGKIWTHLRIGQRFQPRPHRGYSPNRFPTFGLAMEFARRAKLFHCSHIAQSTGISTPVLEKFEKGILNPTVEQIKLIERVVGVTLVQPRRKFSRRI